MPLKPQCTPPLLSPYAAWRSLLTLRQLLAEVVVDAAQLRPLPPHMHTPASLETALGPLCNPSHLLFDTLLSPFMTCQLRCVPLPCHLPPPPKSTPCASSMPR
jgi:hypothetical protein